MSTSFLIPPPPLCGHPLPPSSAQANAHMWANPGQSCQPQQSQAPPPHHLSAATPMLPASSTTIKTTTTTQKGWRNDNDQKNDDDVVCNPHAMSSIPFLFYFPSFCLMTWCATHTLCCQFLFYFIFLPFVRQCGVQPTHHVVNSFLFLFLFLHLMIWHATHMLCYWFLFMYA